MYFEVKGIFKRKTASAKLNFMKGYCPFYAPQGLCATRV
jgi:hypothetical protein